MSSDVQTVRLANLGEFRNGVNFQKGQMGRGLGLINVKDVFGDGPAIDFNTLDLVDLAETKNIQRYFVEDGDLFFVRSSVKRDGIGYVTLAEAARDDVVHCGFVIRFRPHVGSVHPKYLLYVLRSPEYRERIRNLSGGAAITNISQGALGELQIELPDLPTQRRIAGILSAYDDLIENNLRRIRILEEMAQSLYREWFVHFRYPGHESVPLVDSPLGPIPEGWEVKTVPEAVSVKPKLPVPKHSEIPYVPMGSLSETSMLIGELEIRSKASGARFQNGDTLFARITPCLENGKTGFVQFLPDNETVCCGSTEFIVLRSKTVCPEYVYLMARSDPFRENAIKSMAGADGRQRVRDESFNQFLLAQPPEELLTIFQANTQPNFQLIRSLNLRNQTLRQSRDLLLPKLLSK